MKKHQLTPVLTSLACAAALVAGLTLASTVVWALLAGAALLALAAQSFRVASLQRALDAAPRPPQLPAGSETPAPRVDTTAGGVPEHLSSRAGEVVTRNIARLPEQVLKRAHLILKRLEEVDALLATGRLDPERAHLARKIATEFLPEAIEGYLKLPPSQAQTRELAPGKTGYDLLLEQLASLSRASKELLEEATLSEGRELLGNHRFIQEKFRTVRNEFDA